MIFRDFIRLFHLHPLLILFMIASMVTGTFLQLFILLLIVLIHEWGHFIAARYYHWNVRAIILWIFGGVMQTDERYVRPLKEEVIVTLFGPLQHVPIFMLLVFVDYLSIVPEQIITMAHEYNLIILLFNLLPIYPLDGGKILSFIFFRFFPFFNSLRYIVIVSIGVCLLIIVAQWIVTAIPLTILFVIVFLIVENINEWRRRPYVFFRFLYNRFMKRYTYGKKKNIVVHRNDRLYDVFKRFFHSKMHHVYITPFHFVHDNHLLTYYFTKKNYEATIAEMLHDKTN